MKEQKKISLTVYVISLIVMAVIIGVTVFFIVSSNNNKENISKETNTSANIISDEQLVQNNKEENNIEKNTIVQEQTSVDGEKKYVEITEENYKTPISFVYDKVDNMEEIEIDEKSSAFIVQDVKNNNDGTYTFYGRVYEPMELPVLTKEQYETLLNGGSVKVFENAPEVKIAEKYTNKEYDMVLAEDINNMYTYRFLATENSDGTLRLSYNSDRGHRYKGTDLYMKITVNGDTLCEQPLGDNSEYKLKEGKEVGEVFGIWNDKEELFIYDFGQQFIFKDGKCTKIYVDITG